LHEQTQEALLMKLDNQNGIIKYAIAWWLGVPVSLLIVIFLFARGC
jgi:hypothetical protein